MVRRGDWRELILSVSAAILLAACGSVVPRPELASGAPIGVPAGPRSYFVFAPSGIALHEGTSIESLESAPSSAGLPMASAIDLDEAMAAVAYERQVAFLDLSSLEVTRWSAHSLAGKLRGAAIGGRTVALWSDSTVDFFKEDGTTESFDFSSVLKDTDADYIDFALPRGADGLVLVASKTQTAWHDGGVHVLLLDRSAGDWRRLNRNSIEGLTSVHRVASDGTSLFVAGVFEKFQQSVGGPGRLWQDALVFRVNVENLTADEVMRSTRQDRETVIRDLAAGSDSVSLLYVGGALEVFLLTEGIRATTPSLDRFLPGAQSLAWVSENEILVVSDDGTEIVRFR